MIRLHFPRVVLGIAILLVAVPACRLPEIPVWRPAQPLAADAIPVRRVEGLMYVEGDDADTHGHRLDLFVPKGKKDFPVVVLVHGGAWILGDNRCCGLYSSVGEFLASRGIGAVLPNYRLSPAVKHPEHMKDLARAVAWTKSHIADYGGRPDQIFLAGHSAGGHMVALLATDEQYLKERKLQTADIKGVIAICGVYRIPAGKYAFALGGSGPDGLGLNTMAPLRGASGPGFLGGAGLPMSLNVFGPVFGDDPLARADASPVNHVRKGLPPLLLFSAEHDLPMLPAMADEFHKALRANGCDAQLRRIEGRNHNSIMFLAIDVNDPVGKGIVDFVRKHGD